MAKNYNKKKATTTSASVAAFKKPQQPSNRPAPQFTRPVDIKDKLTDYLLYMILFITAFTIYFNSIYLKYAIDDRMIVWGNQFVQKGIDGLNSIFTTDSFEGFLGKKGGTYVSGGRYRPLSIATFALEREFFAPKTMTDFLQSNLPYISHFINVLLYAFLCVIVFKVLLKVFPVDSREPLKTKLLSIPFIAALLYTCHPLHTEVVTNIKGRDDLMAFMFSMLAVACFYSTRIKDATVRNILGGVSMFLALLSKESAITFLAVVPLMAFFRGELKFEKAFYGKMLGVLVPTVAYMMLRDKFTVNDLGYVSNSVLNSPFLYTGDNQYGVYFTDAKGMPWGNDIIDSNLLPPDSNAVASLLFTFWKYFVLLIYPRYLTHDYYFYQVPYKNFADPLVLLTIVGLIGIAYYIFKNFRKKTPVLYGFLFFIITFSVVSNVFVSVGIAMNERFLFFASLGFTIILAYYLLQLIKWSKSPVPTIALIVVICSLYSFKVIDRNPAWYDDLTIFRTDYKTSPNSCKVAVSYGGTLSDRSDAIKDTAQRRRVLDTAITVLKRAAKIYPTNGNSWNLLGTTIFKRYGMDSIRNAIFYCQQGLRGTTDVIWQANTNLASFYFNMGDFDNALLCAKKANDYNPGVPQTVGLLNQINEQIRLRGLRQAQMQQMQQVRQMPQPPKR